MIIIPANTLSTGGYDVDNSCRFNDGDSPRMHKTPGSAGNLTTWTLSMWVKRSTLGGEQLVAHGYADSSNQTEIMFEDNNSFTFRNKSSGSFDIQKNTNMKFTDISAWYNIIIVNKASAQKLFINGVQPTYNTDVTGSYSTTWNNANENAIGSRTGGGSHFDGYICEVVFLDGTAVDDATSFGEFDEDSPTIWKPIDVSGLTFGTNGFYLDMKDSANLGNDANGGTDLTEVNLAATDQSTDTPTNNFATLNPLNSSSNDSHTPPTYSEGNLQSVSPSSSGGFVGSSTIGVSSGKWFFELQRSAGSSTNVYIGIGDEKATREVARQSSAAIYVGNQVYYKPDDGNKVIVTNASGVESSYGATYGNGDIIGIALNMDDNQVTFYKNGASQGTITIPTPDGACFLNIINGADTADTFQVNFGFPSFAISSGNADGNGYGNFEYSVPSGYLSLCTKNLGSDGG